MKKEINRYTLNLVNQGTYIPVSLSTLENIDRLSTNFNSTTEFIDFLKSYNSITTPINNIVITYHDDKTTKEAKVLLSDMRNVVADKLLITKIFNYLSKYSNLSGLILDELDNSYLIDALYEVMQQTFLKDYTFKLKKVEQHLEEEYKLKRVLSIFLNKEMIRRGQDSLIKPANNGKDINEINDCLNKMEELYDPSQNVAVAKQLSFFETDDPYLDNLIENKDYETIANLYTLEQLEQHGARNILDGNRGNARTKRSR